MKLRYLLIGLGVTGIGLAVGILVALPAMRRRLAAAMAGSLSLPGKPLNALSWIQVLPDDRIRLLVPKAEMGQGASTGLAQIAAEEPPVPLDRVEVTHARWRAWEAEVALAGQPANEASYRAAAEVAMRDARPLQHNGFKIEMAKRAITRALVSLGALP